MAVKTKAKGQPKGAVKAKKPVMGATDVAPQVAVKQTIVKPSQPPAAPAVARPVPVAVRVAENVEDTVVRSQPVAGDVPVARVAVRRPVAETGAPAAAKAQQPGWVERVVSTVRQVGTPAKDGMPEHLAAVKAGVLHELETMGLEKGVALQGGPFRNVMLPQRRRKRNWLWPVVAGLVVVLFAVLLLVGRQPADPAHVLAQALAAVVNHDVKTFEERVDVASVASSAVNQLFSAPQIDLAALPPEMRKQLETRAGAMDVVARMNAFIKPGLAENLRDEMLAAVKAGKVSGIERSLLTRLWNDLGGDKMRLGALQIAQQDARMAVAEVPLERADLAMTLPLQVVLTRENGDPDGEWVVSDIPNLGVVLDAMTRTATRQQTLEVAAHEDGAARQALAGVGVRNIHRAKTESNSGLLLTMTVENNGASDVTNPQLKIVFGDAAGQPLKTTVVALDGVLKAGSSREQTWSIPIDRNSSTERYVSDLPLSALRVDVSVLGGTQ